MRERKDENGKVIGYHRMVFDEMPDDYKMQKVLLHDKVPDLSYLGVMKHLRNIEVDEIFKDDEFYSSEVISHMALDYLESACFLQKGIVADRGGEIVSQYLIPAAFLCKHSIELKLKECLLIKGADKLKGHSVLNLWNELNESGLVHFKELDSFIKEMEQIDSNEMALRYGISKELSPLKEDFKFDIDAMLLNTKFLFNILDEHVVCKYRYGR